MVLHGRITESAAATSTFATLRIERRVIATATRTIAIDNIATVSVGTHVAPKPKLAYWLLAALFAVMAFGSMRPDFSLGPLTPTGITVVLGLVMIAFIALALRPDDKTHYLLISSNDGILSRFRAADRSFLDDVRNILTDKINRGDESLTCSVSFEKAQIENLNAAGEGRQPHAANGTGGPAPYLNGTAAQIERNLSSVAGSRSRPTGTGAMPANRPPRGPTPLGALANGLAAPTAESFVDYAAVLPAVVEMHRFYARQAGTEHLEQRLSELEMLMRAGTPSPSQKTRLKELSGEMTQILQAYPQAVDLFAHIGSLAA